MNDATIKFIYDSKDPYIERLKRKRCNSINLFICPKVICTITKDLINKIVPFNKDKVITEMKYLKEDQLYYGSNSYTSINYFYTYMNTLGKGKEYNVTLEDLQLQPSRSFPQMYEVHNVADSYKDIFYEGTLSLTGDSFSGESKIPENRSIIFKFSKDFIRSYSANYYTMYYIRYPIYSYDSFNKKSLQYVSDITLFYPFNYMDFSQTVNISIANINSERIL